MYISICIHIFIYQSFEEQSDLFVVIQSLTSPVKPDPRDRTAYVPFGVFKFRISDVLAMQSNDNLAISK